jgi:hypothetical protein
MEDKIEVGEYVRINNDFRLIALGIGKVIGINEDSIHVKMNFELPFSFKKENIANHSKHLIDLIQVGDYVNGELITDKWDTRISSIRSNFSEEDIKTILTHEQFETNCYEIKEEE